MQELVGCVDRELPKFSRRAVFFLGAFVVTGGVNEGGVECGKLGGFYCQKIVNFGTYWGFWLILWSVFKRH